MELSLIQKDGCTPKISAFCIHKLLNEIDLPSSLLPQVSFIRIKETKALWVESDKQINENFELID